MKDSYFLLSFYLIPLIILIILLVLFYKPKDELSLRENNTIKDYIKHISITLVVSIIPIVNIILLITAIGSLLKKSNNKYIVKLRNIQLNLIKWYNKPLK